MYTTTLRHIARSFLTFVHIALDIPAAPELTQHVSAAMSQPAVKGLAALARPTVNAVQRSAGVLSAQPAMSLLPDLLQRSSMATSAAPAPSKPGAAEFVMTKAKTL